MDPFALLPILSTFSKIKATFNALSQWINDLTTLVFTDASFGDAFVYGSSCRNVEFVGRLRHFWSPIRGATRTDFFEGQQRLDYAEIRSWKTLVATYVLREVQGIERRVTTSLNATPLSTARTVAPWQVQTEYMQADSFLLSTECHRPQVFASQASPRTDKRISLKEDTSLQIAKRCRVSPPPPPPSTIPSTPTQTHQTLLTLRTSSRSHRNICPHCTTSFKTPGLLNVHINRKHERRFQCPDCKPIAAFHLRADLERHRRTRHNHTGVGAGELGFSCAESRCTMPGKVWVRKDNLRRHVERCRRAGRDSM